MNRSDEEGTLNRRTLFIDALFCRADERFENDPISGYVCLKVILGAAGRIDKKPLVKPVTAEFLRLLLL